MTYDPLDAPVNVGYRGDCRAGLAVEDRDLKTEAENIDATVDNLVAVNAALYPPVCLGTFTLPTCVN